MNIASRILEGNGFTTYNFSGGYRFYDAVAHDRALVESSRCLPVMAPYGSGHGAFSLALLFL